MSRSSKGYHAKPKTSSRPYTQRSRFRMMNSASKFSVTTARPLLYQIWFSDAIGSCSESGSAYLAISGRQAPYRALRGLPVRVRRDDVVQDRHESLFFSRMTSGATIVGKWRHNHSLLEASTGSLCAGAQRG